MKKIKTLACVVAIGNAVAISGCGYQMFQNAPGLNSKNALIAAYECKKDAETVNKEYMKGVILTKMFSPNPKMREREVSYGYDFVKSGERVICLKVTYHAEDKMCSINGTDAGGLDLIIKRSSKFC